MSSTTADATGNRASAPPETLAEFTVKAVVTGVILGVVFGAANAYLGLRVGMTISASIPAAVLTVAVFRLVGMKVTILEANISQCTGSASTALVTGTIFTVPALFLWGIVPPYLQVVALCWLGGMLGIAAMIPLRRLLIVQAKDELPYPEGTACAEVLRTSAAGAKGGNWILGGILLGAAVKLALSVFHLVPTEIGMYLPVLPKAYVGLEIGAAMVAIGFILGYRQSAVIVAGAVLSWLVFIPLIAMIGQPLVAPLAPATKLISEMDEYDIWGKYVRYIGAGAVATAGIITVIRTAPSMYHAFTAVVSGLKKSPGAAADANDLRDRDLPGWVVIGLPILVIAIAAIVPGIFGGHMAFTQRLVCAAGVGVFGIIFVTVAARIVGLVGVTSQPTSGICIATLFGVASIFAWQGWKGLEAQAAVLTVGTIVAIAASKAGDISQDLKTGYLVGGTPYRMQFGQLIGATVACWAVAAVVLLLGGPGVNEKGEAVATMFGTKDLAAPQATLMKTVIEGILNHELPWGLVLMGAGAAATGILCGVSGLAFSIGIYLPLSAMAPIFLGGVVRLIVDKIKGGAKPSAEEDSSPGVLAASGLVAGEGLAGVLVAALVGSGKIAKGGDVRISGTEGELAALAVVIACGVFIAVAALSGRNKQTA